MYKLWTSNRDLLSQILRTLLVKRSLFLVAWTLTGFSALVIKISVTRRRQGSFKPALVSVLLAAFLINYLPKHR